MGGQEPVKTEKYFSTGLLAHVDAGKTTLSEALFISYRCHTENGKSGRPGCIS